MLARKQNNKKEGKTSHSTDPAFHDFVRTAPAGNTGYIFFEMAEHVLHLHRWAFLFFNRTVVVVGRLKLEKDWRWIRNTFQIVTKKYPVLYVRTKI